MPFAVSEAHIDLEGEKIGRLLPASLRERLHRDNGDDIEVDYVAITFEKGELDIMRVNEMEM